MYFVAMVVRLQPQAPSRSLDAMSGVYANAAIHRLITSENAAAGQALHEMRRHKQFSCALLPNHQHQYELRVTFLNIRGLTYAHLLVNALSQQPTIRLGQTTCEIVACDLSSSIWAGVSTWKDLTRKVSGNRIQFQFATPTAIIKQDARGRFSLLFPHPADMFASLERRWQDLGGPILTDGIRRSCELGGCVVADHRIHVETLSRDDHVQKGCVGRVLYEMRETDPRFTSALKNLSRLAFFSGVGYQTARGMGTVRTMILE